MINFLKTIDKQNKQHDYNYLRCYLFYLTLLLFIIYYYLLLLYTDDIIFFTQIHILASIFIFLLQIYKKKPDKKQVT